MRRFIFAQRAEKDFFTACQGFEVQAAQVIEWGSILSWVAQRLRYTHKPRQVIMLSNSYCIWEFPKMGYPE